MSLRVELTSQPYLHLGIYYLITTYKPSISVHDESILCIVENYILDLGTLTGEFTVVLLRRFFR